GVLTSCVYQLVLHSFPTRRSSDLGFEKVVSFNDFVQEVSCSNISQKQFEELEATYTTYKEYSDRMYPHYVTTIVSYCLNNRGERSEEHTSELQSRENLVCRLLLEK